MHPDIPPYDPLTRALRNLPPAPHALSRERLLFEAGRAAGRSRYEWFWKGMTAVFGCVTVGLLGFAGDRQPQPIARAPYEVPAAAAAFDRPPRPADIERDQFVIEVVQPGADELAAIRLRRQILEGGIDSMPEERFTGLAGAPRERPLSDLLDGYAPDGVYASPARRTH